MNIAYPNSAIARQKIIQDFHLETVAGSPDSLVTEILSWTGGDPLLTKSLCHIIVRSHYFIPSGMEPGLVEKSVKEGVIKNWQTQNTIPYLKEIQEYFLSQPESFSKALLLLYLKIWQQDSGIINNSAETQQLIALGLVIKQNNKLKVANRLYRVVFNSYWVQAQLFAITIMKTHLPELDYHTALNITPISTKTSIKNTNLSIILAFMSLLGLGFIFPLVLFFNNSQPQFSSEKKITNSQSFSK